MNGLLAFTVLIVAACVLLLPDAVLHLKKGNWVPAVGLVMLVYPLLSVWSAMPSSGSVQLLLSVLGYVALMLPNVGYRVSDVSVSFSLVPARLKLLVAVSLVFFLLLVALSGVPIFSDSPNEARVNFFNNGYLATLFVAPAQAALVSSLIAGMSGKLRPLAAYSIAALMVGMFLLTGNRGLIVFPLLGVALFAAFYFRKGLRLMLMLGAVFVVASALFSFWRNYNAWGQDHINNLARQGYTGWRAYFASDLSYLAGTSEAFDLVLALFPDQVEHPRGSVFFGALISPLPGEQMTAGQFLKSLLGYDFEGFGLAMGSPAGFYMDFGVWGVVAGFLVFGVLARWLRSAASASGRFILPYFYLGGHLVLMNYAHPIPNLSYVLIPFILYWISRDSDSAQARLALSGMNRQG